MDQLRGLWVSDNPYYKYVGQANVTRETCNRLIKKNYHMEVAGFNGPKDPKESINYKLPYEVHKIKRDSTSDIIESIHRSNPDFVILSHDCWMFPNLPKIVQKFPDIKFIGYWTIDGEPISRLWKDILDSVHVTISPTHYGKRILQERYFHLDVNVVPYGADTEVFFPLEEGPKKAARNSNGIYQFELQDKFVCLYVGQNQNRKNIGCSIDAWKEFAKDKDDVAFILLTRSRVDKFGEWVIPVDYDLQEWSGVPGLIIVDDIVNETTLPLFYQISDSFLLPTIGEGFGLPLIEAMACGSIPITTNFSGHTDFCKNNENSLLLDGIDYYAGWNTKRKFVPPEHMYQALEFMYQGWKNKDAGFEKMKSNAIDTAKLYDWDYTANGIDSCIREAVKTDNNKMNMVYKV